MGVHQIGETRITHGFRTVKLWELDPEPVLADGDPGLLPWALLMRLGREEAHRLGARIAKTREERCIARFLTLGALRYDRAELEQMLGGYPYGTGRSTCGRFEPGAGLRSARGGGRYCKGPG